MTDSVKKTPVRGALVATSRLLALVEDGLGALDTAHRVYLDEAIRQDFADSLEIDENLKAGREQENRWDYLLGHKATEKVIGVEPHAAKNDEVTTVIKKRRFALDQLRSHLRNGVTVERWLWVASKDVHFADTEKTRRQLDQNGIQFVGKRLLAKHLPVPPPSPSKQAKSTDEKLRKR